MLFYLGGEMKRNQLVLLVVILMGIMLLSRGLTAKVTEVVVKVIPPSFEGECPKRFDFVARITVDSPGTVKYQWTRSDGAIAPVKKLIFQEAGSEKVTSFWQLGGAGKKYVDYWKAVKIHYPNQIESEKAYFTLECTEEEYEEYEEN
jgi:hypothetical protein